MENPSFSLPLWFGRCWVHSVDMPPSFQIYRNLIFTVGKVAPEWPFISLPKRRDTFYNLLVVNWLIIWFCATFHPSWFKQLFELQMRSLILNFCSVIVWEFKQNNLSFNLCCILYEISFSFHTHFSCSLFADPEVCRQLHSAGVGREGPCAGASPALSGNRRRALAWGGGDLQLAQGHTTTQWQSWNPVSPFLNWILKIVKWMHTSKKIHLLP